MEQNNEKEDNFTKDFFVGCALNLFIGIPYDNVYSKEVYYVTK